MPGGGSVGGKIERLRTAGRAPDALLNDENRDARTVRCNGWLCGSVDVGQSRGDCQDQQRRGDAVYRQLPVLEPKAHARDYQRHTQRDEPEEVDLATNNGEYAECHEEAPRRREPDEDTPERDGSP